MRTGRAAGTDAVARRTEPNKCQPLKIAAPSLCAASLISEVDSASWLSARYRATPKYIFAAWNNCTVGPFQSLPGFGARARCHEERWQKSKNLRGRGPILEK